jgi:hypothetical protein
LLPFGGISLYDQILPLEISEPAQLFEKCGEGGVIASFRYVSDRARSTHDRNAVHFCRLLSARRERPCDRAAEQRDDLAPIQPMLHAVPASFGR